VRVLREIFTDDMQRLDPRAKARGYMIRRKALWVVLGVSFTGGGRGGPGQAGKLEPSCPRKTGLQGGHDSCRSAGADNRRCL
jgi:hypothetical protein